jgi:hypothetical protein
MENHLIRRKSKLSVVFDQEMFAEENQHVDWPIITKSEKRICLENCMIFQKTGRKELNRDSEPETPICSRDNSELDDDSNEITGPKSNYAYLDQLFWNHNGMDMKLRTSSKICCPISRDDYGHEDWRDLL